MIRSDDLETQEDAYFLLAPAFADEDAVAFCRQFLERAVISGGVSLTRHFAAAEFGRWMCAALRRPDACPTPQTLAEWLADLYRLGSDETRMVLVNGLLEGALRTPQIRRLFRAWKRDPVLGHAYRLATFSDQPTKARPRIK